MEKIKLKASKRTVLGRKVKNLRQDGILPGSVYGKKVKSTPIQVSQKEFDAVFQKAGETHLIELLLDNEVRPVLIHNLARDVVTDRILNVDFLQVDLKEKVTTKVPVIFMGEAPAVKDKVGTLLHLVSLLEVEALPADLPEKIEIDISKLAALDQSIKIADVKLSDKVKILTDSSLDIVKVAPLISKEAEKLAKEEAEAKAAAAAAAATTAAAATPEEAAKPAEVAPTAATTPPPAAAAATTATPAAKEQPAKK